MEDINKLLAAHRLNNRIIKTKKITFRGVKGEDVYNIAAPLVWQGKTYLPGRVEPRHKEASRIVFFAEIGNDLYSATKYQILNFQDPCVTMIDEHLVIGGTEIFTDDKDNITHWHTTFYKGTGLDSLEKALVAPYKMKDVRLLEDKHGIHVFSRPQGGKAGPGKIGYTFAAKFSDITTNIIDGAAIIPNQFSDTTWGGVNDAFVLKNGWLGILGHIATFSAGNVRHYYGMTFAFNPKTKVATQMKIICERNDFAAGETKRPDLVDVVFVGGIIRHDDGLATLYAGLSDAEGHYAILEDPFMEYERLPQV